MAHLLLGADATVMRFVQMTFDLIQNHMHACSMCRHDSCAQVVEQGFDRKNPYVSGIVELEEGGFISARITGLDISKPEEIKVGAPLTVDFLEFGEGDAKKTYLAFKV